MNKPRLASRMLDLNRLKQTRQILRIAVNVAILIVLGSLFILKERFDRAEAYELERSEATMALTGLSQEITAKLTRIRLVSSSLSGAVALKPDISQADFEALASKIAVLEAGIMNIATIRDTRVDLVFPFEENAALVGRSLNSVPEQLSSANAARETGQSVLQGPVKLMQGVDGYILRAPVFLDQRNIRQFWGLISIVFPANEFFQDVGLEDALQRYEISIVDMETGAPVFGAGNMANVNVLRQSILTPGGTWEISLAPRNGWGSSRTSKTLMLFFVLSAAAALSAANVLFNQRIKALRASELLQSAIDVLADAFVLFDKDERLVICNQKYLEFYAASAPAIVPGARFEDILRYGLKSGQYKDAAGREEAWIAERLAAHRAANTTLEQKLEDGRWLRVREMPTPDGGRVGIRVDITQQVESRKRAEVAELRLRDAIDTVPAGFWLFDREEKLELVNARALEPFAGTDHTIAVGNTLEDVVNAIVASEFTGKSTRRMRERKSHLMRLLRQTSSEFQIQTGPESWYKYFGQRTQEGGLVCFGADISELVQHELWLQHSNVKLRRALSDRDAAEARFADVADIATEWFWEQDAEGHLTYLSPGFEKATGTPAATVLGRNLMEMVSTDPDQDDGVITEFKHRIAAREPFNDLIYKTALNPGVEIWIRSSGKPIFDKDGEFRGYIGAAADISRLYFALREAQQADEAKTQFLNVISHELRTPISIILGFNAFLAKVDDLPEFRNFKQAVSGAGETGLEQDFGAAVATVKRFAGKIRVAGEQLQRLVNDILDLARIEARTLQVEVGPVDAAQIIHSVVDQIQPMVEGKDVRLVVEVEELVVRSDAIRLRQILTNLITNAAKFTDAGQIAVRARRQDGMAEIQVSDTGIGIPREALANIFERFTQVDTSTSRNQGGVGLGLSISQDLIRLQGGTVRVESELGEGTTVTFTMPLWTDADTDAQSRANVAKN